MYYFVATAADLWAWAIIGATLIPLIVLYRLASGKAGGTLALIVLGLSAWYVFAHEQPVGVRPACIILYVSIILGFIGDIVHNKIPPKKKKFQQSECGKYTIAFGVDLSLVVWLLVACASRMPAWLVMASLCFFVPILILVGYWAWHGLVKDYRRYKRYKNFIQRQEEESKAT